MTDRKPLPRGMAVMGVGFAASGVLSPVIGIDLVFGSVLGLLAALLAMKDGAASTRHRPH